jgi:hypothetical protein
MALLLNPHAEACRAHRDVERVARPADQHPVTRPQAPLDIDAAGRVCPIGDQRPAPGGRTTSSKRTCCRAAIGGDKHAAPDHIAQHVGISRRDPAVMVGAWNRWHAEHRALQGSSGT